MASPSYLESLLVGLDPEIHRRFRPLFQMLRTLKLGQNFSGTFVSGTTAATANAEFLVAHGLGVVPTAVLPALDPGETGAKVVPLTVTRPADSTYLYLSSSVTNAPVRLFVES